MKVFSWNSLVRILLTQRETVDELTPLEEEIVIVVSDHHEDIEDIDLVCADLVAVPVQLADLHPRAWRHFLVRPHHHRSRHLPAARGARHDSTERIQLPG